MALPVSEIIQDDRSSRNCNDVAVSALPSTTWCWPTGATRLMENGASSVMVTCLMPDFWIGPLSDKSPPAGARTTLPSWPREPRRGTGLLRRRRGRHGCRGAARAEGVADLHHPGYFRSLSKEAPDGNNVEAGLPPRLEVASGAKRVRRWFQPLTLGQDETRTSGRKLTLRSEAPAHVPVAERVDGRQRGLCGWLKMYVLRLSRRRLDFRDRRPYCSAHGRSTQSRRQ